MSSKAPSLSRSATFALDLARQPDGYLAPSNEVIDELRNAELVTTRYICDGFVIVKAVEKPSLRRARNGRYVWRPPEERISP